MGDRIRDSDICLMVGITRESVKHLEANHWWLNQLSPSLNGDQSNTLLSL